MKKSKSKAGRQSGMSSLLKAVLSQPTAPFRESWVRRQCLAYCRKAKVPVFEDPIGNLWVNCRNERDLRAASLVFVAHMDHPGMVITQFKRSGRKIIAQADWLGGGPKDIKGFPVKLFSDVNGLLILDGKVISHTKSPRGPKDVKIEVKWSAVAQAACNNDGLKQLGPWGACLWYSGEGLKTGIRLDGAGKNRMVTTKAADDLVGVCALIEAMRLAGKPRGTAMLLTRAEESGFHGALAVLEKGWLNPKRTMMVSVETSAFRPNATFGKGPVVRLGDRMAVFEPGFVKWMETQAQVLAKKDAGFHFQRALMDGGTCEASAFICYGFRAAGLSVPLKNYHNEAPGSARPHAEGVNLGDVENLAKFVAQVLKNHRRTDIGKLGAVAFKTDKKAIVNRHKSQRRYFTGF